MPMVQTPPHVWHGTYTQHISQLLSSPPPDHHKTRGTCETQKPPSSQGVCGTQPRLSGPPPQHQPTTSSKNTTPTQPPPPMPGTGQKRRGHQTISINDPFHNKPNRPPTDKKHKESHNTTQRTTHNKPTSPQERIRHLYESKASRNTSPVTKLPLKVVESNHLLREFEAWMRFLAATGIPFNLTVPGSRVVLKA